MVCTAAFGFAQARLLKPCPSEKRYLRTSRLRERVGRDREQIKAAERVGQDREQTRAAERVPGRIAVKLGGVAVEDHAT